MSIVCQSIRPSSLLGWENQAIVATRSPTAIKNIRPLLLRRKQVPETSRSGTSITRRTRSWFLFLPFSAMGESLCVDPQNAEVPWLQDRQNPRRLHNGRYRLRRTETMKSGETLVALGSAWRQGGALEEETCAEAGDALRVFPDFMFRPLAVN
jgi:hypothetical protein